MLVDSSKTPAERFELLMKQVTERQKAAQTNEEKTDATNEVWRQTRIENTRNRTGLNYEH